MGGANPRFGGSNKIVMDYEALTNFTGGQMLIPQTGATKTGNQGAQPAGDAAKNCIGVAQHDALTFANQQAAINGTTALGFPILDASVVEINSAVYTDVVIPVAYAAGAVAYGAKLCCAAAGKVRAWVTADGADAIVGWCAQIGGTAGGVTAYARILV